MGEKYLKLADIDAYVLAYNLSNYVWDIVITWDYFAKKTVGSQFVTAADSNSANIAEGFGRYFKKDKIKFYRYTLGSVRECYDWNQKSYHRKLVTKEQYDHIFNTLNKIKIETYSLINYTNEKLKI